MSTQVFADGYDPTKYDKNDVDAVNAILESTELFKAGAEGYWRTILNAPGRWEFVRWSTSNPKRVISLNFSFFIVSGTIDASKLTELTYLFCSGQAIKSINVEGLTKLTTLKCGLNDGISLNLSGATGLTELSCEESNLTALNLNDGGFTALTKLNCNNNPLTSLDVSGLTALAELDCSGNQLTNLNVKGLTALTNINCSGNPLTSLDVSDLTALTYLDCGDNQLTSLNLSGAIRLSELNCQGNLLTSLNVSGLGDLQTLLCFENKIISQKAIIGLDTANTTFALIFDPQNITRTATPTASKVLVNGKNITFDAYTIESSNYFKLRDLAKALSGTNKQFKVTWSDSKNAINLISGERYTPVGGELASGDGKAKTAERSTSNIFIDDIGVILTAYTIGGSNYFKLRDLMQEFDVGVGWDSATSTITINTNIGYIAQ